MCVDANPNSSNAAQTARSKASGSEPEAAFCSAEIASTAEAGGSVGIASAGSPVASIAGQSSSGRLRRKRRSGSSTKSGLLPRPSVRWMYCESAV